MSVLRCPLCQKPVDTDYQDMYTIPSIDEPVCEDCLFTDDWKLPA